MKKINLMIKIDNKCRIMSEKKSKEKENEIGRKKTRGAREHSRFRSRSTRVRACP